MNLVDDKKIENIVLRLLEGEEITPEESSFLKQWIQDNPEKSKELHDLSLLWTKLDTLREVTDDVLSDKWSETKNKISGSGKINIRNIFITYRKYAAIFVLGALLPIVVTVYQNFLSPKRLLSQVIEVPYGAKSTITLPDGTEIVLNAGSKISYNASFGHRRRDVALSGEAYFKVAKNKHKPFVVKTNTMTVTAYGTEFNVKCYMGENVTETTLVEGSVGIKLSGKSRSKEYMLKPNQQLIYSYPDGKTNKGRLIIAKNINTQIYTSWVYDKIQVNSISLKELAVKLERKYNVTIHIEDKDLEGLKFTGILENETIEQILQALELSASIRYKIDEREIWLYKNNN